MMSRIDRVHPLLTRRAAFIALLGLPFAAQAQPGAAVPGEDGFIVLRAMEAKSPILGADKEPLPVWAYEGQCPGPTLRVKQGTTLKVRLVNQLAKPTMIHWHGVRVPNAMDGTELTQQPVAPGESFDYVFAPPDAGTFWYHAQHRPEVQVDRGLYGTLIVEEPTAPDLHELVLTIDDWLIDSTGHVDETSRGDLIAAAHEGRLGNWLTLNGSAKPHFAAPAERRLRLRLVNAANARIMSVVLKGTAAWLAAVDGHPVAPLRLANHPLELAPGQRADLILPRSQEAVTIANQMGGELLEIASIIRQGRTEVDAAEPPPPLGRLVPAVPNPEDVFKATLRIEGGAGGGLQGARHRGRRLSMRRLVAEGRIWALNGEAGMTEAPLFRVEKGREVHLLVENRSPWPQSMHLHGHYARVTGRSRPTEPMDAHRDTVLLHPRERATLAFVADNPGKWLLASSILEHQSTGLATWFEVV
jgi:FtsP/CotA-like multicopper oxidase with cupredoxin domain